MNPIIPGGGPPETKMSTEDVVDLVREIHGREDDFEEGDIEDRIYKHGPYFLKKINIQDVDLEEFDVDYDYVKNIKTFIDQKKQYVPPIVYRWRDEFAIIDGAHRLNAMRDLGIKTIYAYVGKR